MGADGGSIPDRRDLVRTKAKAEITDKALLRELFFLCALSKRPLTRPVVLDPLGKLYNKDAVLEFFLDRSKYGDGDQICGYLKGVKDLLTLNLLDNPTYSPPTSSTTSNIPNRAPFVCPLSLKEMSGAVPFIALNPCGCVFSDASVRAVIPNLTKGITSSVESVSNGSNGEEGKKDDDAKEVACPNCGNSFDPTRVDSIAAINPPRQIQEILLENLLTNRAATKGSKKRKAAASAVASGDNGIAIAEVRINGENVPTKVPRREGTDGPKPPKRSHNSNSNSNSASSSPAPPIMSSMPKSVHQKLAEQEQKRLAAHANMSDAVKSMFRVKEDPSVQKPSTSNDYMTRSFNRYAA